MHRRVPDEIRRFILTSVPSVPYLEALLLMRAASTTVWDAPTLARRLYLSQPQALELLSQMMDAGLVVKVPEGWHWRGASQAEEFVERLAALYLTDLRGVTELIHSREDRRAHQFADAFRLRRDKEE